MGYFKDLKKINLIPYSRNLKKLMKLENYYD